MGRWTRLETSENGCIEVTMSQQKIRVSEMQKCTTLTRILKVTVLQ